MKSAKGAKRLLVVEGYSDKRFFLGVQRHLNLGCGFTVIYPGDQSRHPGKAGAKNTFKLWLEEAAEPGRYESIGICIDADFPPEGGFDQTDAQMTEVLAAANFRMTNREKRLYEHQTSKCKASYWVAPAHGTDGYLETMALKSLTTDESIFLATTVLPFVKGLEAPRFDLRNVDRASLYTYLAIQRKPDKSLPTLLDDGMIDINHESMSVIGNWLVGLFGEPL